MRRARHTTRSVFVLLASLTIMACGAAAELIQVQDPLPAAVAGRVWVSAAWGPAPGAFGIVDEASRPGPMDFAMHDGHLYVLDPVNARVQVFDPRGGLSGMIPIGTRTADFICVDTDGSIAVLDAFVKRELRVFAPSGELLTAARLPDSLRLPSAIFADNGQYLVEERHNRVLVLQIDRARHDQIARPVAALSGRPRMADAETMHARKLGLRDVVIDRPGTDATQQTLRLRFPRSVRSIVALESDEHGNTYVAAACLRDPPVDGPSADIVITALAPDDELLGVLIVPDQYVTDHYRKLLVTPDGDVVQMQTLETGVRFIRWRMPASAEEGGVR